MVGFGLTASRLLGMSHGMRHPHLRILSSCSLLLASFGGAAGLSACSSSDVPVDVDAAMASPDSSSVALADIAVTIGYTGAKRGSLVIAAFRSLPPMGPPAAFQTVSDPTFPATVTLRDLQAGTYYVMGVLDMAPASPTQPGAEDLQKASGPMVMSGTSASVSLTLVDP